MSRIERRDLIDASRLGKINLTDRSDPVAGVLRDLGITESDLRSIGNGDSTLRGADEFGALYDRLAALDKADSNTKTNTRVDRASRLYASIMERRSTPRDKVPAPKALADIKSKDDYKVSSSEKQTEGALRVLDKLDTARTMPADIKAAAKVAISTDAKLADRQAAQKKVDGWVAKEAAKLDSLRAELARQELHLRSLIGWKDADGEHAGYYDRLISDAKKSGRSDIVRWAAREQAEVRDVYRDFMARSVGMNAVYADAAAELDTVASILGKNSEVFADVGAAEEKYADQVLAIKQNGGALPEELLESKDWIARYDALEKRLEATHAMVEQLTARAAKDPGFDAWLKSSGVLETLELQEQGLANQQALVDGIIGGQKIEIETGRTGVLFALRDDAVQLAQDGVAALTTEDDTALEKRERELSQKYKEVRAEIRELRGTLKTLEAKIERLSAIAKPTAAQIFELKEAEMIRDGVLQDSKNKPISLKAQISVLEGAAEALDGAKNAIDHRRSDLKDVVLNIGKGYGRNLLATGSNQNTIDSILELEKYASTPGLTVDKRGVLRLTSKDENGRTQHYHLGKDTSYGEMRQFVLEWGKIQQLQQAKSYYVARELLLANGLRKDDLEALGLSELPNPPQIGFVEERLTYALNVLNTYVGRVDFDAAAFDESLIRDANKQFIAWAQAPTDKIPGVSEKGAIPTFDDALLLVKAAKTDVHGRRQDNYLTRDYLLTLITNPSRTEDLLAAAGLDYTQIRDRAPKMIAFAKALLANETLQKQLSANSDGVFDLREVQKYGEQWKMISDYQASLPKTKGTQAAKSDQKSVDPTYFKNALGTVQALDPFSAPWSWNSTQFFGRIAALDEGDRAFTVGLFDAYYSQTKGKNYLNNVLQNMTPGEAVAFSRILTGTTAKQESESFVQYWVSKPNGYEDFARHHEAGVYYTNKADNRNGIDMPPALMHDYEERVKEYRKLVDERAALLKNGDPQKLIPGIEKNLIRLAGQMEVLGSALIDARNAEQADYDIARENLRSFVKKLGVAVAASAAAYFTAGAAAPEAGFAWAAVFATTAGTAAGMGVAFTFDLAEQLGQKGFSGVSLKQAGQAALDAAPEAFTAALATGVLTAGMLTRAATIYKGIETARAAGTLTKGMQIAAHARVAGGVALYAAATTYVGNFATAAYLWKTGKVDQANELLSNINRDAAFAGISSAALMPLARFKGATGFFADVGGNMLQTVAYNKWVGNPLTTGLGMAAVSGGVLNRIFATGQNVEAAARLKGAGVEGETVKVPGASEDVKWTIKSVDEKRGAVVVDNGVSTHRVMAHVLLDANPQLLQRPSIAGPRLADAGSIDVGSVKPGKIESTASMSAGASLNSTEAAHFFTGSKMHLKKFVLAEGVVYKDLRIAADGTITGKMPGKSKVGPLTKPDGTPLTALDLVKNSPASLLPAGLTVHDPASGATLKIKDVVGWENPRLLVEAHDAGGKYLGTTEMTPAELVARGVEVDTPNGRKAMFGAKDVAVAAKELPSSSWSSFDGTKTSGATEIILEKGPALNEAGDDHRKLRTSLEQSAKKILAPKLKQNLGSEISVETTATPNKDGTVEMTMKARLKGEGSAVAELTLTIDPKKKTVHIDDAHVAESLRGKGIGDRLFAAQSDFLSANFAGWEVTAKIPDPKGAAAKLFERNFAGAKYKGDLAQSKIPSVEARIELIAPKHGWQSAAVTGIDRGSGELHLQQGTQSGKTKIGDVLDAHPELVMGMELNYKGERYWVGSSDGKGKFELIPQSPDAKVNAKWPKVTGAELHRWAPDAVEALLSPPAVRVKTQQAVNGEFVWRDNHGYSLIATDKANGMAYVRNANGGIEAHAMENIAYEHSGVAFGSLSEAQHQRYQARIESLPDTEMVDFYKARAEAADASAEHAALVDRAFAAGASVEDIRSLVDATRNISQEDLGKAFSVKGQTQHFQKSCLAGACLFGLSVADPVMAKIIKDNPELGVWWQKEVLERNGRGAQPREDGDYAHTARDLQQQGTGAQPLRSGNGKNWYQAKDLHPTLSARGLNDKNFWKNRKVVVSLDRAGKDVARIYGDDKGNVYIERPIGGKAQKTKLPLFEAARSGDELVLALKTKEGAMKIDEIGLPSELTIPARDNGMNMLHDTELMMLLEMKTGQKYVMRKAADMTNDQLVGAVDWSLSEGHPVQFSVEWMGRDGKPLNQAHALWIAEKRTINGKPEYLVYDPHYDEPRWLGKDQLSDYTNIPGGHGKPIEVILPDYINLPGKVYSSGTAGVSANGDMIPPGVLLKNRTQKAVAQAEQTVKGANDDRANGRPVDEGKLREAEVVLAFAKYAEANPDLNLRITRASQKLKDANTQKQVAEIDLQTDAVLYEITIGSGQDKLAQFDQRRVRGSGGNEYDMPVVLIADKAKLSGKVSRGLDQRGAHVVHSTEDALQVHKLYKTHGEKMARLWKLEPHERNKAFHELLAAKSEKDVGAVTKKYGLDAGEPIALHQTSKKLLGDGWDKISGHLTEKQETAVRAYLEQARKGDIDRVNMFKNADGSVTVTIGDRRSTDGENWQNSQATFGKDGSVTGSKGEPVEPKKISQARRSSAGLRVA